MCANIRRYPKPLRFPIGNRIGKKRYMRMDDVRYLFSGKVIVEEKMDGKQSFIETDKFILWVEDLKVRHSIKYMVPGRYALFDVFDKSAGYFLDRPSKLQVWEDIKNGRVNIGSTLVFPVPLLQISSGLSLEDLPALISKSSYAIDDDGNSTYMEGIVVKPQRYLYYNEFLAGKLVRREFAEGITDHYLSKKFEYNIIDPSIPIVLDE